MASLPPARGPILAGQAPVRAGAEREIHDRHPRGDGRPGWHPPAAPTSHPVRPGESAGHRQQPDQMTRADRVVARAQDGSVAAVITDGRRGTLARDHRSIVAPDRETTMTQT